MQTSGTTENIFLIFLIYFQNVFVQYCIIYFSYFTYFINVGYLYKIMIKLTIYFKLFIYLFLHIIIVFVQIQLYILRNAKYCTIPTYCYRDGFMYIGLYQYDIIMFININFSIIIICHESCKLVANNLILPRCQPCASSAAIWWIHLWAGA